MSDDGVTETTTERTTERTTQGGANQGATNQPNGDRAAGFTDLEQANREIARLRDENASRRTGNRSLQEQITELQQRQASGADVQQQIADLQGQLQRFQAATEAGISSELLAATQELQAAKTADEMKAANEKIARLTAQPQPGARNPTPPRQPSAPPSRDEQLTAAVRDGNMREVERINADKLVDLGG